MKINNISNNQYNQNFEALKIDRKALRNLGYRSKKSLLQKNPALKKLSERTDVYMKKGTMSLYGSSGGWTTFSTIAGGFAGGALLGSVGAVVGIVTSNPVAGLALGAPAAFMGFCMGMITGNFAANAKEHYVTDVDIAIAKDNPEFCLTNQIIYPDQNVNNNAVFWNKSYDHYLDYAPCKEYPRAEAIAEEYKQRYRNLNEDEIENYNRRLSLFPQLLTDTCYYNFGENGTSKCTSLILNRLSHKLKNNPEMFKELIETEYEDTPYNTLLNQYFDDKTIQPIFKEVLSEEEFAEAEKQHKRAVEYYIEKLNGKNSSKTYNENSNSDLKSAFLVLQAHPEEIVKYANTLDENRKELRSAFHSAQVSDFPLHTVNVIMRSQKRPDLLAEFYLAKPHGEEVPSLFETMMSYNHLSSSQADNLSEFLSFISYDIKSLQTAKEQAMASTKATSEHDRVIENINNNLNSFNENVSKAVSKTDFQDINEVLELLNNEMVTKSKGAWLNGTINNHAICQIADIVKTGENAELYDKMIERLKELPHISYNKTDVLGIPFIEKVLHSENEQLLEVVKNKDFGWYPLLDKAYERIISDDFREKAKTLNIKFPDVVKACELSSLDALELLEPQFKSPFMSERYKKSIISLAMRSTPEFMIYLALKYKDYLPEDTLQNFKAIIASRK